MIITNNLYQTALIQPIQKGCNCLKIISGYSTAAMAYKHISEILQLNNQISVQLLVGMTPFDGISLGNHRGFIKLVSDDFPRNFSCSYIFRNKPVHSKAYLWYSNGSFKESYIGSANYTQNAFLGNNRELLANNTDSQICDYWQELERDSIFCDDGESEHLIQIYREYNYRRTKSRLEEISEPGEIFIDEKRNLDHIKVSFLDRHGELPSVSGLNWGQRQGREKNQAYIPLKSDVYNTDFFPDTTIQFTIHTDDDKTLIATRAQANGKAIHTPQNNSLIGEYFRMRLGLANGAFITKNDLEQYGRTDVDFYKIDSETYYMDFSL